MLLHNYTQHRATPTVLYCIKASSFPLLLCSKQLNNSLHSSAPSVTALVAEDVAAGGSKQETALLISLLLGGKNPNQDYRGYITKWGKINC